MYLGRYPYADVLKYIPPVSYLGCGVFMAADYFKIEYQFECV